MMAAPDSNVAPFRRKRPKGNGAHPARPDWFGSLLFDSKGQPYPNLANVMVALRNAPELGGMLAFDLMLNAPILVSMVPGTLEDDTPRAVRDTDVAALQEWLQKAGLPKIG